MPQDDAENGDENDEEVYPPELCSQPKSIAQRMYEDFEEVVVAVIYFTQIGIVFVTANWLFGPKSAIHSFAATIVIFLAISSIRSSTRLYKWIWKVEREQAWYVSKFVLASLIVCFLFALSLDVYNYNAELAAAKARRENAKWNAEMKALMEKPETIEGMRLFKEYSDKKKKAEQVKSEKSSVPPVDNSVLPIPEN